MNFNKWLDTFISEKGIDLDEYFTVEGPSGINHMSFQTVVDALKSAPDHEQKDIKTMLVKIDYLNHDVRKYLRHLAQAIAM